MPRRQYRLTKSTLAVFESCGSQVARPISEESVIEFNPDDILGRGAALIEVLYEGKAIKMFVNDLKVLAIPVG